MIAARRRRWGRWLAGALAIGFGVATLIEGSHVAFGGPAARAAAGPVVPFVLYFNLVAGAGYVAAGVGAVRGRGWALTLARALAATTLLVFAAFGVHVLTGGAYAARTVGAMALRSAFWIAQAIALARLVGAAAATATDRSKGVVHG